MSPLGTERQLPDTPLRRARHQSLAAFVVICLALAGSVASLSAASASHLDVDGTFIQAFSLPGPSVVDWRVDVCLRDSSGAALVPDTTSYRIGSGSVLAFANAIDSTTSCKFQVFPAGTTNVEIWTSYNHTTSAHATQDISANPVFVFESSAINVRVQDATGAGVAGALVRFGGPSGTAYYYPGRTTDASGQLSAELFAGSYTFSASLNHTSATKTQDVGADPIVGFSTTTVTLGYSGAIAFGGPNGDSAWFTPAHSREFLPGTVNFRFDFASGGPIRVPIDIASEPVSKSMIVATLLTSVGTPVEGVDVWAEPGGISLGTTNANGVAYALVDGALGLLTVSFEYGGETYSLTQDHPTNSIFRFSGLAAETTSSDAAGEP